MEYTEELQETNNRFLSLIYDDSILIKAALLILLCVALFFIVFSFYKKIKSHWNSTYFILLCVSVIVWAVFSLLALFSESPDTTIMLNDLKLIGIIPIPLLLCLHIRQQVSYKEEKTVITTVFLLISVFLIFIILRAEFFPGLISALPMVTDTIIYYIVFYLYATIMLIRSYLLCFGVLYQMPKRTRQSSRLMIIGISAMALLIFLSSLIVGQFSVFISDNMVFEIILPLLAPIAFVFLLYPLYTALHVMPASDVIVTSREFVMSGLDTTVLVMNLKKQILDWNRNDWEHGFPLPKPLYKEPFDVYRRRILELSTCRVSPHSKDIIIMMEDGKETYFLLRVHKAGTSKRQFGFVVEISMVTPLYRLLRYFEEIAYYDTLTGLYNRNAYFAHVKRIKKENLPLLIFVGDVNHLKKLNDDHGHLVGDELLKIAAKVIQKAVPENAFVARTGGDEFVMLVPGGSDEMANKFVKDMIAISERINHEVFGSPSISWGYAIMTSMDQSYNDVFKIADAMMYEYKKMRHRNDEHSLLVKDLEKNLPTS